MGLVDRVTGAVAALRGQPVYIPNLPFPPDLFSPFVNFNGHRYPLNQTLGNDSEPIGAGFSNFVEGAYKANGIVYACSAARLMLLSQARFQWQRMVKGQPGDLFGNPALAILENPEPGKVTADLLAHASVDIDFAGNAFIARRIINGSAQLKRLRPDWVDIVVGTTDGGGQDSVDAQALGYIYYPGGRYSGQDPELLLREEVAHIAPIPDPMHRFRGMSWLTPIIRDVQGDSAATAHKELFFQNGATVNMIVQTGLSSAEPDKFEKWVQKFNSAHQGEANAYKTLFLTMGADATPVGSNFMEMDFAKTQSHDETRIAVAAGVHPVILGISEGLGGSSLNQGNFMAARRLVADMTLRPWWGSFSASLEVIVSPPPGCRLWYDEKHIPFLAEDVKDAAEVLNNNASTINTLTTAGFEPDAVIEAVTAGDLTRLKGKHSGLFSVQLQPPMPDGPPEPPPLALADTAPAEPAKPAPNGSKTPAGVKA